MGSKGQTLLLKVVMLHIKLNGMEHRVPCKHIFCPNTHPRLHGWGQRSNHFYLLKVVMLHIKTNASTYNVLTHPGPMGVRSKGKNIYFTESSHAAYQIKGFRT